MSPHETLLGTRPALAHLRRFGYKVYRHLPEEQRVGKFSDRARPSMMLGYVHHATRLWRLWDFSLHGRGGAVESSNVRFVESLNAYGALVEPTEVVYFPDLIFPPGEAEVIVGRQFPLR